MSEFREIITTAIQKLPTTQHKFARLLGLYQSHKIACPEVIIWLRSLYKSLKNDQPGDTPIYIPEELNDLVEAEQQIMHKDQTSFKTLPPSTEFEVDASKTGVGAALTHTADAACKPKEMAELLPTELIGKSSTRRELRGVRRALEHFNSEITASTDIRPIPIRIKMDSQASVNILLKRGSPIPVLNDEIKR